MYGQRRRNQASLLQVLSKLEEATAVAEAMVGEQPGGCDDGWDDVMLFAKEAKTGTESDGKEGEKTVLVVHVGVTTRRLMHAWLQYQGAHPGVATMLVDATHGVNSSRLPMLVLGFMGEQFNPLALMVSTGETTADYEYFLGKFKKVSVGVGAAFIRSDFSCLVRSFSQQRAALCVDLRISSATAATRFIRRSRACFQRRRP